MNNRYKLRYTHIHVKRMTEVRLILNEKLRYSDIGKNFSDYSGFGRIGVQ
jgi:hypothetical protein